MRDMVGKPAIVSLTPTSAISLALSSASPKMGGMTIRNENCANFSFLLPSSKPVAMVLPERLKPGSTATACAIPMTKACQGEICSLWRGFAQ